MYLPPWSTLLRVLQLPLSLPDFDPSTLPLTVPSEQSSKDLSNLGNLSPYHTAPAVPGVSADLPDDCSVDRVILLHRHGSRGPSGKESNLIGELFTVLKKAQDIIQVAPLPTELQFLKEGYKNQLVPEELTIVGRDEVFDNGARFALHYPSLTFSTNVTVSTTVQRVVDTAHFFSQGYFGRAVDNVTFWTTQDCDECGVPVSWLDPVSPCKGLKKPWDAAREAASKWAQKYVPPIKDRLNGLLPGVDFTVEAVRGALYACPYDLATRDNSPWCNVFTADELRGLEYETDLFLDGVSGHTGDPGYLLGAFYIKKLIDRLTDETSNAQSLYLDFAHDTSILFPLSTMGLNKDASPLSPDKMEAQRKFRSSNQTPFAANMVWEKFTCETSFQGPQVRLLLNEATLPLSICQESENDKKYGTCSLEAFVHANQYSMHVEYQNELWNATCS